jgi:glycosyltransferase involved in cell wall biosynthesis
MTKNNRLPLSVSIIASNEEENLQRSFESLQGIAAEIIFVYNNCTDRSVEVAKQYEAICYEESWHGHRDQKNIALKKTTQPWVLCIDADEALSPQLRESIIQFLMTQNTENINGATINRRTNFIGKWICHGDWYPDTNLRLIRNGKARWEGSREHDKLKVDGKTTHLKGDLLHYSYPSLTTFINKIIYFSDIYLDRQLDAGKRWRLHNAIFRPLWRFFRAYFLRLGFLDGFPGFFIAASTAFNALVRHSRLYEYQVLQEKTKK